MRLPIEKYFVRQNSTIKETMKNIDSNRTSSSLVVDDNNKLLGMITDGDIRRALLKEYNLKDTIKEIYFKKFKSVDSQVSKKRAKEIMIKHKIRQLPVVDENGKPIDIYFLDDIISYEKKHNYVVIMAGGKGTRMGKLTKDTPKPMLKLGDKPMLEHIIMNFIEYGYNNFLISVNYKSDVIEEYFKNGKGLGINIEYINEDKPLGTAGALSLMKEKLTDSFIVINGDILTGVDFDDLMNYHKNNSNMITAGVREYEFQVPFGVIMEDNGIINQVKEKPEYTFNVLSGVYVLDKETLEHIPNNEFYNMPDLINEISSISKCGIYTIKNYWMDVGVISNYNQAQEDISKFF